MRDLAFPLIEPPYNRQQWDSVLYESGIAPTSGPRWPRYNAAAYSDRLLDRSVRSAEARYAQLIDDIRNDSVRVGPFVSVARRVRDMDDKRYRAMAHFSAVPGREKGEARRRIAENAAVLAWVNQSLSERVAGYRLALERVVIDTPSPRAVEAERALNLLRQQIATARLG
jgi:hypothetical protein